MPTPVWYATREDVKSAMDAKETARNNAQIDRNIAASTVSIERDQLHRRFYPQLATRRFNWPTHVDPQDGSRTISLGDDELVSCTELKVGGVVIDSSHFTLLPVGRDSPPYTAVELDSTVTLVSGSGRRAVEITGLYGYRDDAEAVGTLLATLAPGASSTASISWNTARFGVGDILHINAERLIVTNRTMVDSTQNLGGSGLTAQVNDQIVPVSNGAGFALGEILLIDAERMLVVDIAGNNLVVKRQWDGSTLAAHTTNADIYTLTGVQLSRGQLGTIDAQHLSGATIDRLVMPPLVNQLCIAEAIVGIQQENSAYGKVVGSGDAQRDAAGAGLEDLRERAYNAHGRKVF